MSDRFELYLTCPKGLEGLLAEEARGLGLDPLRALHAVPPARHLHVQEQHVGRPLAAEAEGLGELALYP